eukprot:UN22323
MASTGTKRTISQVRKEENQAGEIQTDDKPAVPIKTTSGEPNTVVETVFSPELLKLYYEFMFPIGPYSEWLSYYQGAGDRLWFRREFSFTTEINGQEIYQRYKSFDDIKSFHNILK